MVADPTAGLLRKLGVLRAELTERAFDLERRGAFEAADLAMVLKARLDELCDEAAASPAECRFPIA